MSLIDWVGWAGNALLATCAAPLLYDTVKTNGTKVSRPFMWYWLGGEVLAIWFAIYKAPEWPILTNYFVNIVLILIIIMLGAKKR